MTLVLSWEVVHAKEAYFCIHCMTRGFNHVSKNDILGEAMRKGLTIVKCKGLQIFVV